MAVVAGGRPARTDYRVVGTYSNPALVSRLECRLETGRTHQIRVHLASINHPLIGDPTYSQRRPNLGLTRPFLHAAELAFVHPATGERVTFLSPLAPDLQAWLDAAEV
jgi:23S rRNA pseudouridine1911/1915/1917 synthase